MPNKQANTVWPKRRVNYTVIIDRLGGYYAVADAFRNKEGWGDPGKDRVYIWHRRNQVPSKYLPFLLALAEEHGVINKTGDLVNT